MSPFPIPKWAYGALALLIALASFAAYQRHEGASAVVAKVTQAQVQVTQVHTAAKAKTEAKQEDVTAKVSQDYEERFAALRSSYAAYRVRHPTTSASRAAYLPSVSTTPGQPDAAPRCEGLSPDVASVALEAADENTLKLIGLQAWVNGQYEVNQ